MKPRSLVTVILGIVLAGLGIFALAASRSAFAIIPLLVGIALCFLGWRGDRRGLVIFGHICIVLGCFLITWGIYLLPYSRPVLLDIFARPLFWGMFCLLGGVCANFHGFCQCMRRQKQKE